jgi:osmotically-inducible protein OsmY
VFAPLGALAIATLAPPLSAYDEPGDIAGEARYTSHYEVTAPRPESRAADQALVDDVKIALASDAAVNPAKIDVDVERGSLTLRGQVRSDQEGERAARIARGVAGTTDVHNYLRKGFMN